MRLPVPTPVARARPGRGRLPHRRHQGRRRGPGRRDRHHRGASGARRSPATATRSRWCSAVSTRSTATSTPTCARRSRSCGSTTRRSPTSPRRRARSASGSAAASSACCTWRSSASGSSASTTSRSSPPRPTSSTSVELADGRVEIVDNPSSMPHAERDRRASRSRTSTSPCSRRPSTSARSWSSAQQRRGEMTTHGVPLGGARRARLRAAARRDRHGLLRPAEVAHPRATRASTTSRPATGRRTSSKVDVLLNNVPVDAFSTIVHRDKAYDYGRRMTEKLRELIPRQLFDVPIQAAIGGRIIARETVKAKRKDVHRQVLRRRHHAQAQAARAPEGGEEADEADRPRRGPPGGVRRRAPARRLMPSAGSRLRRLRAHPVLRVALRLLRLRDLDRPRPSGRRVRRRVRARPRTAGAARPRRSVFFGGGTPSLLAAAALTRILDAIPRAADAEVTVECNPDSVDVAKLARVRGRRA